MRNSALRSRIQRLQRRQRTDPTAPRRLTLDEVERLGRGTLTEADRADPFLADLAEQFRHVAEDLARWRHERWPDGLETL